LEFEAVATLDPYAVTDLLTKELASLSANADSKLARESRSSSKILTKLGRALDERSQPVRNKPDWMLKRANTRIAKIQGQVTSKKAIAGIGKVAGLPTGNQVNALASALAERARSAKYILTLAPNIVVFLIRVEEDGDLVDYRLRYQRLGLLGSVLIDEELTYDLGVH